MNIDELKKEIPFKWKPQSTKYGKAICVAFIDARDVMDLLDNVVGAKDWKDVYQEIKGVLYCGLGIKIGEEWIFKYDCGVESNMEGEKGQSSDAFKRAAVKWGVGRFLYSMPIVTLPVAEYKNKAYPSKIAGDHNTIIWSNEDLSKYINSGSYKGFKNPIKVERKPVVVEKKLDVQGIKKVFAKIRNGQTNVVEQLKHAGYILSKEQIESLEIAEADYIKRNLSKV